MEKPKDERPCGCCRERPQYELNHLIALLEKQERERKEKRDVSQEKPAG